MSNFNIVDYSGLYVAGPMSYEEACACVGEMNAGLSLWERMAGYYYSIEPVDS